MQATTPLNELITSLALLGWEFKGLKVKNGAYVASAKNSQTGQDIERTGNSPEMAVHAVFQHAQRANNIRAFARQNRENLLQYVYGEDHGQDWKAKEEGQGTPFTASEEAPEGSLGQEVDYWWPEWDDIDQISQTTVVPHQGYRDTGLIEGAVGNARMAQSYGKHSDIFDTAADIIAKVQRQQAVVEGNKRTATALGLHFLQENGYNVDRVAQEPFWSELVEAIWRISDAADPLGQEAIDRTAQVLREACVREQPTQIIGGWTKTKTISKLSGFYFWSADIHELAERQRQNLLGREDIQKMFKEDTQLAENLTGLLQGIPDQGYKLMPWAVREWKLLRSKIRAMDPNSETQNAHHQEMSNVLTNIANLPSLLEKATKWVEYARTYNLPLPEINRKDFDGDKMWAWIVEMQEKEATDPRHWKDSEAVYTFPDSWYIAEVGPEDLVREGRIMQHCVGGGNYYQSVRDGDLMIFSLREPNGQPHATMSLQGNWNLINPSPYGQTTLNFPEIYGKQDRAPEPEYEQYIDQWFQHLRQLGYDPQPGEEEPPEPDTEWIDHDEGPYDISDPEEVTDFGNHMRLENGYYFMPDEEGNFDEGDNTIYYQNPRPIYLMGEMYGGADPVQHLVELTSRFLDEMEAQPEEDWTEEGIQFIQDIWMLSNVLTRQVGYQVNYDAFFKDHVAPALQQMLQGRMYHQPQTPPQDTALFDQEQYHQDVYKPTGQVADAMHQYVSFLTNAPTEWTEEYETTVNPGGRMPDGMSWTDWHATWPTETRQRNMRLNWPGEGMYPQTSFDTYFNQIPRPQIQAFAGWVQGPQPKVHLFDDPTIYADSGEVYDETQTSDDIKDGDVLVVYADGVVGIMVRAWPTAITQETGAFHDVDTTASILGDTSGFWQTYEDGRYWDSYQMAVQEAQKLNSRVASVQPIHSFGKPIEETYIPIPGETQVPEEQKQEEGELVTAALGNPEEELYIPSDLMENIPEELQDVEKTEDGVKVKPELGHGVRVLVVEPKGNTVALHSPTYDTEWPSGGEWLEAHRRPEANSNHGINIVDLEHIDILEGYKSKPWIVATVEFAGYNWKYETGWRAQYARPYSIQVPANVKWYGQWTSDEIAKMLRQQYLCDVEVVDLKAENYDIANWSFSEQEIEMEDGWAYTLYKGGRNVMEVAIHDETGYARAVISGAKYGDEWNLERINNSEGQPVTDAETINHVVAVFEELKAERNFEIAWAQDAAQGRDEDHTESTVDWDSQEVRSVDDIEELIRVWYDIQKNSSQFTEYTPGDSYSDTKWVTEGDEGGPYLDDFGLPMWFLSYTEYPPTAINLGPDEWRNVLQQSVDVIFKDWWDKGNVDEEMIDELAQALYGVPAFLASGDVGGSQFDHASLKAFFSKEFEWGIQYALGLIGGSQYAQEETLFDTEEYGRGIGLQAHPKLNRFFNLLQYYVDNSHIERPAKPDLQWSKDYTIWNDPVSPEWGRSEVGAPAIPGALAGWHEAKPKRDPNFIWIWYKSELRIEAWHHNRKHKDMIDELFDEFGRDFSNEVHGVEPDEVAAGVVYEYSDGSFKIEHEQMNDPEIRDYAENAIEDWLGSWVEVTFKKKRKKK